MKNMRAAEKSARPAVQAVPRKKSLKKRPDTSQKTRDVDNNARDLDGKTFILAVLNVLLLFAIFVYAAMFKDGPVMKRLVDCIPYILSVPVCLTGGAVALKALAHCLKKG